MAFPLITADTTLIWVTFWNTTLKAWADSLGGTAGDGTAYLAWAGEGRYISAPVPDDDGDRFLPPSPSLAITLPEDERFLLDGILHTLEEDVTIPGVPANFTGWVIPVATIDEATDEYDWTLTTHATRPPAGSGAVYVESDADSVNVVDVSEAGSDTIPTAPYISTLVQRITALEAGGEGEGGGGGYAAAQVLPWEIIPGDVRGTTTVVKELIAAALAEALAAAAAGGAREMQTPLDQLFAEHALTRRTAIALSPDLGEMTQSANLAQTVAGLFGNGGEWPDFIDTDLTINADGVISP